MPAVRKPPLMKPIISMEGTHCTANVVFQWKKFICVSDMWFSNTKFESEVKVLTNWSIVLLFFAKCFIRLRLT